MHSSAAVAAPLLSMTSYPIAAYHYTLSSDIFVKQQHRKLPQKESEQPLGPTLSHLPGETVGNKEREGERPFPPLRRSRGLNCTPSSFTGASQLRKSWKKTSEPGPVRALCRQPGPALPSAVPGDRLQSHQLAWWSRGTEPPAWAPRAGTKRGLGIAPSFK